MNVLRYPYISYDPTYFSPEAYLPDYLANYFYVGTVYLNLIEECGSFILKQIPTETDDVSHIIGDDQVKMSDYFHEINNFYSAFYQEFNNTLHVKWNLEIYHIITGKFYNSIKSEILFNFGDDLIKSYRNKKITDNDFFNAKYLTNKLYDFYPKTIMDYKPVTVLFRYCYENEYMVDPNRPGVEFLLDEFIGSNRNNQEISRLVDNLKRIYKENNIDYEKQKIVFTPIIYNLRSKGKPTITLEQYLGEGLGVGGNISGFFMYNNENYKNHIKPNEFRLRQLTDEDSLINDEYFANVERKFMYAYKSFIVLGTKLLYDIDKDPIPDLRMVSNPQQQLRYYPNVGLGSTFNYEQDVIKMFKAAKIMTVEGQLQLNSGMFDNDFMTDRDIKYMPLKDLSRDYEINMVGECNFLGYRLDIGDVTVFETNRALRRYNHSNYGSFDEIEQGIYRARDNKSSTQDEIFSDIRTLVLKTLPYSNFFLPDAQFKIPPETREHTKSKS